MRDLLPSCINGRSSCVSPAQGISENKSFGVSITFELGVQEVNRGYVDCILTYISRRGADDY